MRFSGVVRRLPPSFFPKGDKKGLARHVKNVTMPFVPNHNTPYEETGGYGQYADANRMRVIKEERQRAWARYGEWSGIEPQELLPTEQELQEQLELERIHWPNHAANDWNMELHIKEREFNNKRKAEQIKTAMNAMPALVKRLTTEPKQVHVPAIKKKLLEREKTPPRNYITKTLTDQEIITDMAGVELDPRSLEYKALLKTVKAKRKNQRVKDRQATVAARKSAQKN